MQIRILDNFEKNKIRPLYEQVFDDSKEFVDYYFNEYVNRAVNFVCEKDGAIVGMASIHEKMINVSTKVYKVGYVYAVATSKEYRRQGIMRCLLEAIDEYAKANNYEYLYLIPVNPKIYYDLGYTLMRNKEEKTINYREIGINLTENKKIFKVNEENIEKCLDFLSKTYENKVSIHYDKEFVLEIIKRFSINNSGLYCILDETCDKILGLALIEDDDKINLIEYMGAKEYMDICLMLVMKKLNVGEIFYKLNDIMFKGVQGNIDKLLDYSICINDEI